MKLNYKEEPKEWTKSVLLPALGLAIIGSVLSWRRHLSPNFWSATLGVLAVLAVCAVLQPRWFRGWYRLSLRMGFYSSQFIGRCVLMVFFVLIITPMGWILRLACKDLLQLKRPDKAATCWQPAKDCTPLDQVF